MRGDTLQPSEILDFSEKAWLAGQREALAAALDDAPLADSLGILVRTATEGLGPGARAGFYLANAEGTALRHVVGMPAEYAEAVDGFKVGPDSLACGLATHTGQPVLTADVTKDPLWEPWVWMAEKFGYRACWSFPIHTRARHFAGTLAIYWPDPREATPRDCELAAMLTQAAGIIIARHMDAEIRRRTEAALRQSQAQLQSELEDTQLLQSVSAQMVREGDADALYEKILDAAMRIMRSQFVTIQRYHRERGEKGELFLLASRGLSPEAKNFWQWVRADSGCTCGHVLRTGQRAIAEDIEKCDFIAGTADGEALLNAGIRAAQSTPLYSRGGELLGMISTHWSRPHKPTERDLRLLDIVARQAADLIERKNGEEQLRSREERYRQLVEQTPDGIFVANSEGRYIDVSPAGCEMLGMTREDVLSSVLTDVLAPEEHHRLASEIARFDDGSIVRSEWRMRRKDGSIFVAEILGRRLPNGNLQGIVRDVTEHRRREDALRKSQVQLQSELVERRHAETIMRQRGERLELLSETLAQLLAAGEPDSIVKELFPKVARHLGVDTYFNYMVDESGSALKLHSCAGVSDETARAIERLQFGQAICGTVAQTRSPIHATDIQHSNYDKAALVRGFGIQCYACNPLLVGDRLLGTLSFASRSRVAFEEDELHFLRSVAQHAAVALDRLQAARHLRESEERFRMLADNMNQLAWTCDRLGDVTWYNHRWLDYTGLSFEEMKDWGWKQVQHPDHVDRVVASVTRSQESGEPWEDTFPLRGKDGEYRWFLSRAVPIHNAEGEIVRWFGTNTDITEHKLAEDTQRLLLNELNHRVKNTLAIVQSLAHRTAALTRNPAEFAKSFGGRIQSLARVHTLLSDASWGGTDLRELIRDQLLSGSVDESKLTAWGPAVRLDPQMALHLALVLHELGTNSSKYGALSGAGWVTISWTTDDALNLRWVERGGPPVASPPKRGFGTTLIEQSAKGQGGDARMLCEAEGITWDITLPLREDTTFSIAPQIVSATTPVPEAAATNRESPSLAGQRFLVVEDEPLIGLDIAASLEDAQAIVEGPVATAEQALEIIERTSLDGALLDASLHGRPVDNIARALTRRNVPFIFVTGYGPSGLSEAFRHVAILNKPCSREQVIDAAAALTTPRPNVLRLRPNDTGVESGSAR